MGFTVAAITGIDSDLVERKVGRPIQSLLSPNPGSREMLVASTRSAAVECYGRHRELQGLGNWWLCTLPGADALNNKSIEEANHLVILCIWIGTSLKRLFISPCYWSGYCWEIFLGAKDEERGWQLQNYKSLLRELTERSSVLGSSRTVNLCSQKGMGLVI